MSSKLKNLELSIDNVDSEISLRKTLYEIKEILEWFQEWLENIEETISKEN